MQNIRAEFGARVRLQCTRRSTGNGRYPAFGLLLSPIVARLR